MSQAAKKVCMTADVEKVLDSYPAGIRKRMEVLRNLILRTAARTEGVGVITETLKWGEPAYLTEASKSGSTIRMGWKASSPDHYALYFNCRTTLVDTFRTLARHCRDFRRNEGVPIEDIKLRGKETTPSQVALRKEVADRVRAILGETDAVAIDMMLENRDWAEIGEQLGVKADAARMRVRPAGMPRRSRSPRSTPPRVRRSR